MDTLEVIFEGLRIVFGFLLVLFLPGFTISLVYFPRSTDLSLIERLVYSTVLSIGSVMVLVLFMEFVLGVNTTPRNIALFICTLCGLALLLWWCERWYLKSHLKTRIDPLLSGDFERIQENDSRETNAVGDLYKQDTKTEVVSQDVFSPLEDRQILRDTFDAVIEKLRNISVKLPKIEKQPEIQFRAEPRETSKHLEYQFSVLPVRKLQKEIVRDMDMFGTTPDSFGKSNKNIENITIPKNGDINNKKLAEVEEDIEDLDWHN